MNKLNIVSVITVALCIALHAETEKIVIDVDSSNCGATFSNPCYLIGDSVFRAGTVLVAKYGTNRRLVDTLKRLDSLNHATIGTMSLRIVSADSTIKRQDTIINIQQGMIRKAGWFWGTVGGAVGFLTGVIGTLILVVVN